MLGAARREVDRALQAAGGELLATSISPHGGDRAKFAKFLTLMGFKFHCTIRHSDGVSRALYMRRE